MTTPPDDGRLSRETLAGSEQPLCAGHDSLLLDLDGVVYLVDQPINGVDEVLAQVRTHGVAVEFVTNNASRRASEIAEMLTSFGVPSAESEVVTSGQVAAMMMAERLPAGASVLVVGSEALVAEVAGAGLRPVRDAESGPAAVLQGYGREVGWKQLAEATIALRSGVWWVASNTDRTLPSPRGLLPGNGALVAALATATDRHPDMVIGKPEPWLWMHAARRRNASRPLVVGDRLDTDIAGANRAGMDSLAVLTGVATAVDLLLAPPEQRPRYVAADLAGVLQEHPALVLSDQAGGVRVRCRDWEAYSSGGLVKLDGDGDSVDALRALCGAAWRTTSPVRLATAGEPSARAIAALGLEMLVS